MVKFSLSAPRTYIGGVVVQLHALLTLAVEGCEWLTSSPCNFAPMKEPQYPVNRKSWSGCFGEQKNLLTVLVFEPWTVQLID